MVFGVVDMSKGYDLEGQSIESVWKRGFTYPSTSAPRTNQAPIKDVPDHSRKQSNQDVVLTSHPQQASRLKKDYSYISTHTLNLFGRLYGDI